MKIYDKFFLLKELSHTDVIILSHLTTLDKVHYFDMVKLSKKFNLTRQTIAKSLKRLEQYHYIRRELTKNKYYMTYVSDYILELTGKKEPITEDIGELFNKVYKGWWIYLFFENVWQERFFALYYICEVFKND